jgi:large subunit ribosomal protein L24
MPAPKCKIKKNDLVMVVSGRDRGKTGKVTKVLPKERKIIVERVNLVKRHLKPRSGAQAGGIVEKEAPLSISKVMVFCEQCNAPVRIGYKTEADKTKTRVCRRCGAVLASS